MYIVFSGKNRMSRYSKLLTYVITLLVSPIFCRDSWGILKEHGGRRMRMGWLDNKGLSRYKRVYRVFTLVCYVSKKSG